MIKYKTLEALYSRESKGIYVFTATGKKEDFSDIYKDKQMENENVPKAILLLTAIFW